MDGTAAKAPRASKVCDGAAAFRYCWLYLNGLIAQCFESIVISRASFLALRCVILEVRVNSSIGNSYAVYRIDSYLSEVMALRPV